MPPALEPNKSKIAKRVIEILEFFSENSERVTVMDIVRRYGRPQSSTSELLSSLVEMGLLYKDSRSRSYSPTPRVAALGASAQPPMFRDGSLFSLMDDLAGSTGNGVALFGMVGTYVQIFRLTNPAGSGISGIGYGASESLSASAAGLLLLSTMAPEQVGRILWRLKAEAPPEAKFNPTEIREHVGIFRRKGAGVGQAGFGRDLQVAATLLPRLGEQPPLALGVLYPAGKAVDPDAMISLMNRGIAQCGKRQDGISLNPPGESFKIAV